MTVKLKRQLRRLPDKPGVYVFRDRAAAVLYVGKSKRLRQRVRSYFQPSAMLEPAKRLMVGRVADVEMITVDSELEALLLESTLIKRHRPPFNIIFRDDKNYQYLRITLGDDFPRVETVRRVVRDGSRYFGPFTSGYALRQTLDLLKRIFPYKRCSEPPERLCFEAKIGRCLGHRTGPDSQAAYGQIVHHLIRFLEGDTAVVEKQLEQAMRHASARREYELAARLRDRRIAVGKVTERQKVISTRLENEDIIGLHRIGDLTAVNLFQIRRGKLTNREHFVLEHTATLDEPAILASFIEQYYVQSTDHPTTVVTRARPDRPGELEAALQLRLVAPNRGKKRQLVRLAEENARQELEQRQRERLSIEQRAKLGLGELQRSLLMVEPLDRIECYDISNVQGAHAVGAMIVFQHGRPKTSDYRKFTIRTVIGANDYAMLQEVLKRRFGKHRGSDGWPDPDLIIIDGGKGQLHRGLAILRELRIVIPTIGLAKRQEEIFRPGQSAPLRLPKDSEGLYLLQRIRDEAHRFAIGTYRARHGRATTGSRLDDVPGIGPVLKRRLIQRFGSVRGIQSAAEADLETVVGPSRVETLRQHLG